MPRFTQKVARRHLDVVAATYPLVQGQAAGEKVGIWKVAGMAERQA